MRNLMNSDQSYTGLVQKYIGSAYDVVRAVYMELDLIKALEEVIASGDLAKLAGMVDEITKLIELLEDFQYYREIHVATEGQTLFLLNLIQYVPGTNSMTVYKNGIRLVPTDFTEVSYNEVLLHVPCIEGDLVEFVHYEQIAGGGGDGSGGPGLSHPLDIDGGVY